MALDSKANTVTVRQVVAPILDPRGRVRIELKPLAERLDGLVGKSVALLDNTKEMAAPMLAAVHEYLESCDVLVRYYRSLSCP